MKTNFVTIKPNLSLLVGAKKDLWISDEKIINVFKEGKDGFLFYISFFF